MKLDITTINLDRYDGGKDENPAAMPQRPGFVYSKKSFRPYFCGKLISRKLVASAPDLGFCSPMVLESSLLEQVHALSVRDVAQGEDASQDVLSKCGSGFSPNFCQFHVSETTPAYSGNAHCLRSMISSGCIPSSPRLLLGRKVCPY